MYRILYFMLLLHVHVSAQTASVSLFFDLNSTEPHQFSIDSLQNLLIRGAIPEKIDSIIAYTDPSGNEKSNLQLSKARNSSVERILKMQNRKIGTIIAVGEAYDQKDIEMLDYPRYRRVDIFYTVAEIPLKPADKFSGLTTNLIKEQGASIVLEIEFLPGEAILLGNSYDEIMRLYNFLVENDEVYAFIRGHVCCAHDPELSTARAYLVYTTLLRKGIPVERISYQGFSNSIPAVSPEITEEDRQRNRRVDVQFSILEP